jgi:hypothetical protein
MAVLSSVLTIQRVVRPFSQGQTTSWPSSRDGRAVVGPPMPGILASTLLVRGAASTFWTLNL